MVEWWAGALVVLLAATLGWHLRLVYGRVSAKSSEQEADRMIAEARREVESIKRDAEIQAKAVVIQAREAFEAENKTRRQELAALEARTNERELNLDRKVVMLDKKSQAIDQKLADAEKREAELARQRDEYSILAKAELDKLQRVAGMTVDEARQALATRIEEEVRHETGILVRRLQEEAKENAEREAKKIVALAIQRYSSGHANELMTSAVSLPNEEMKGRIIGRDGRNIRALEAATGVDLLVDDTPEMVVISAFDPLRREMARQILERLIVDGRIHPARIEEIVAKVREEMEERIRIAGDEAIYAVGLHSVAPELGHALGRLQYRSSFAQNVLTHSIEVAQLMGVMAGEMGLDVMLAKRIGLFHDIGKALDSEVEGNHAIIGADFLRRHGESQLVLNAVAAHHADVEAESVYATLVSAADAISASRPGARAETTAIYIKRLEQLESIAGGFQGVEKTYAIQAGREVRVIVQPEKTDDAGAMRLARDISKKIEQEMQYPGQIKVTVIREKRCVEYAR